MALRYAILGLLNYREMTGYELKKLFDDSIRNVWHASMSQIYRELNALEKEEHVRSVIQPQSDRPDKRIYSITESGKAAFKEWIMTFPEKYSKEKRDEFCLRLFFGSRLTYQELISQFEKLKKEKEQELKMVENYVSLTSYYLQKLALFGGEEMYWKFILRRAAMNLNTTIAWANDCIAELEKG